MISHHQQRNNTMNSLITKSEITFVEVISKAASDPTVDVNKMERLLDMQERLMRAQSEAAFNEAMNRCQRELPAVTRSAENKHTKSKYAKLEAIDDAVRPTYTGHGFSLSFSSQQVDEKTVKVTCRCSHVGGHSRDYELSGQLDTSGAQGTSNKTSIQGLGSTVSYLRRYLTCMIFNVILTDEDRDGNAMKSVTPAQIEALSKALGGDGERIAKFCKNYDLPSLSDLDASQFDLAMAKIKEANAKRGEQGNG